MKKLFLLFILIWPLNVMAAEKWDVKFSKCVDGDTVELIYNNEEIKVRLLAVDTPETKHPTKGEEPFGQEASDLTCELITNAKELVLEFDDNSDQKDKYDRYLGWLFVDGNLLQEELINQGYAKVAYLYGDYKYTSLLEEKQEEAIKNTKGIWGEEDKSLLEKEKLKEKIITYGLIILAFVVIIVAIFNKKVRNKLFNKIKREVKKEAKKMLR